MTERGDGEMAECRERERNSDDEEEEEEEEGRSM